MGKGEWKNLAETKSFRQLSKLAEAPFDLTTPDAIDGEDRLGRYICRGTLFDLHYGTERIDDEVLDALQQLADELNLIGQYKKLRRGSVMNRLEGWPSEERQVLHTATRDIFSDAPAEPKATSAAKAEIEKLAQFLSDLDSGQICNERGEPYTELIHVGIGGSDLGPRSIYEALKGFSQKNRKVHFIANVDPDDAAATLKKIDLTKALVSIVSKSGTTLETLANETFVRQALVEAGLDPRRHCLAVTGAGSPMDDSRQYLRSFYMFDYIGGRYSSTSMVGLVMLGYALGLDHVTSFLRGATTVDWEAESDDIRQNLPLLLALLGIWNHNFLHSSTLAILPYCQMLHRFPAHLQQCDMESNGKSVDRYGSKVLHKTGPVIWGEPGTNGQHAFYQLLHQGTEIVPIEFIGFRESQLGRDVIIEGSTSQQKLLANMYAQIVALAQGQESSNPNKKFAGNRPSCLLLTDRLSPEAMGALLAIYEAKIVFQGFVWNINSFDQEGVQLGKVLAKSFLMEMVGAGTPDASLPKSFLKYVEKKL